MTPLQFHRAVAHMDLWSASSDGFSFVISHESPAGTGFHGRTGYLASWRGLHSNSRAMTIGDSPLETFAAAEEACNAMLDVLNARRNDAVRTMNGLRHLGPNAAPTPRRPPAGTPILPEAADRSTSSSLWPSAAAIGSPRPCSRISRRIRYRSTIVFIPLTLVPFEAQSLCSHALDLFIERVNSVVEDSLLGLLCILGA